MSNQQSLFPDDVPKKNSPVTCLGLTFKNDNERRAYFTEELRKKLPELRKMEGFPVGEDEDILALSDPPYYTACPNPFINDFIEEWGQEKMELYGEVDQDYHREPFAVDVSEGKNDPVYLAHGYHTKVPYKAIIRYIMHYTNPGDVVLDGFSGTGMTGKATSVMEDPRFLETVGYKLGADGTVYDEFSTKVSQLGRRNIILNDLSPAAGFIAYNFNRPVENVNSFAKELNGIIDEVEGEFGWMYGTNHSINGGVQKDSSGKVIRGSINYVVWSDVFICPHCATELVFWESGVNQGSSNVDSMLQCKGCHANVTKRELTRATTTFYDGQTQQNKTYAKLLPVMINYSVGSSRFEKVPDGNDIELLSHISDMDHNVWFPINELPQGHNTTQPMTSHGFTHVHYLASLRNQIILGAFREEVEKSNYPLHGKFLLTSCLANLTWMYRWRLNGKGGITTGTYYTGPIK